MLNALKSKIVDRYIVRKYLTTFTFAVLIFSMISMAIDFSDKVQSFIEKPCTLKQILLDYYSGFVVHITGLLLPMYTLISVIFFTSRLAFNAEILSMLNAGISFNRLLKPYLFAGGIITLFHLTLNHFLIPKLNKSRLLFEHTYVWTDQEKGRSSNVHLLLAKDIKVYIRGYNKINQSISGLRLIKYENNKISSMLEAEQASYQKNLNKWQLTNYQIRTFQGKRETLSRFSLPIDTTINLVPEDFIYYQNQNQEMTSPILKQAIRREINRGQRNKSYEIEYERRTADACTNILLTIIGMAVTGRKVRGGMGLHLAIGIAIGSLFILTSKFAVSFVSNGSLPVTLGMWVPNIIFGCVAFWLAKKAQK